MRGHMIVAVISLVAGASSGDVVCVDSGLGYDECVINNGSGPPSADNVIDDATYAGQVRTYIRNAGCPPDWGDPWIGAEDACPSPGVATQLGVVAGASVYMLRVRDSSSVEMSGGTVSTLRIYDDASAHLEGGQVSNLFAYDSSVLTVEDGLMTFAISASGTSTVSMNGGTLQGDLWPRESASVSMTGGTVTGYLKPFDASSVTVSGGWMRELFVSGTSDVTMSGGAVGSHVTAYDSATITLTGGTVVGAIHAAHSSAITIEGSDFAVDGSDVPYGELAPEQGELTGTLASGDDIDNYFYQGQDEGGFYTGTITLVENLPEVDVAALHACALLGLALLCGRRGRGERTWPSRPQWKASSPRSTLCGVASSGRPSLVRARWASTPSPMTRASDSRSRRRHSLIASRTKVALGVPVPSEGRGRGGGSYAGGTACLRSSGSSKRL